MENKTLCKITGGKKGQLLGSLKVKRFPPFQFFFNHRLRLHGSLEVAAACLFEPNMQSYLEFKSVAKW